MAFLAADWGSQLASDSVVTGGPLDQTAHLLTALLFVWALGRRACERFLAPALIASVAIDLDHVPGRLASQWLTAGTPRPYTHSLLTIAVLVALATVWRRRRDACLGIVIGFAIHFWRDLAEGSSGVSLLWPFSYRSFSLPHASYLLAMIAVIATNAYRSRTQYATGGPLRVDPRARATGASQAPRSSPARCPTPTGPTRV